jgi:hypothetical protein
MYQIKSLDEAIKHINNKLVFDENNYPGYDKLDTEHKCAFAVRHLLLHNMKSLPHLLDQIELVKTEDHDMKKYEEVMVKMIVNTIRSLSVVGVSEKGILHLQPLQDVKPNAMIGCMGTIASELEKIDHGTIVDGEVTQDALVCVFGILKQIASDYNAPMSGAGASFFTFDQLIGQIPQYMKSK